jgi:trimethylamine--corrinoid protein Co-methyltransferase
VDGTRVRFPAALVDQALSSVTTGHLVKPRGGDTAPLALSPGATYFGTGPDCLYVCDVETGERRRARLDDVTRAAALAEKLPNLHFVMSMALPEDAAGDVVDLAQFAAMASHTRKPIVVSSPFGGASLRSMHEMAALCGEADSFACLAMSSPPLMLDEVACDKALVCAELSIPFILAPSPSAGTSAPASLAAVVVVANAEVLAGLVLHQLANPGAPFVYGVGVSAINMRTMVDAYLPPPVLLGDQVGVELAQFYGLPSWSYAGCSDSKVLDEQWSLELGVATAMGALGRATLLHDVGYLESGLQSALEAMVLGDEMAGYARALLEEVPVDDEALQLAEIIAVGPGGNHLARPFTRAHYRRFWRPGLLDQSVHDRWHAAGATTLRERVQARTLDLVSGSPAFTLDPAIVVQLERLVATGASA